MGFLESTDSKTNHLVNATLLAARCAQICNPLQLGRVERTNYNPLDSHHPKPLLFRRVNNARHIADIDSAVASQPALIHGVQAEARQIFRGRYLAKVTDRPCRPDKSRRFAFWLFVACASSSVNPSRLVFGQNSLPSF